MPETVVIAGAGVTGLSTAYHLARRGRHRIVVVDKGPVGDGSSSRAAAIITGRYDPRGGYSEPDEYLPALRAKCLAVGVEIREREPVGEILVRGGRAAGVRTAAGEIPAVNANPMFGYVRPAAGGRLLLGIETPDCDEERVDSQAFHMTSLEAPTALKDRLRANFRDYIPALGGLEWEAEKVGLLTFASDGEPILGPVSRLPGLFVGVAFHSGGFAYNPASGLLLAEFVADGKTQLDLAAFSPDRFSDAETAEYLAETVKQRDVVRRRH